jgi:hypothetical protein
MRKFWMWAATRVAFVLAVTFDLLVLMMAGAGKTDVSTAGKALVVALLSAVCWVAGALCWVYNKPKEKMHDA